MDRRVLERDRLLWREIATRRVGSQVCYEDTVIHTFGCTTDLDGGGRVKTAGVAAGTFERLRRREESVAFRSMPAGRPGLTFGPRGVSVECRSEADPRLMPESLMILAQLALLL
jgi:hypothetical protein